MPALSHSPADLIRQVLIDLGLGTAAGSWPIFVGSEPDTPDNCLTVFDTTGVNQGRIQYSGEIVDHEGIQVRARGTSYLTGWVKLRTIRKQLSESVRNVHVTVDSDLYTILSCNSFGDVLALGRDQPTGNRYLFTLNLTAVVKAN